jgi:DNA replication protein DnaC
MKEYSRAGEALRFPRVTAETVRASGLRLAEDLEAAGRPVQSQVVRKQLDGGDCAVCKRPYRRTEVSGPMAEFGYFAPDCSCEEDEEERRETEARVEGGLELAGVPGLYRWQTFDNWDWGTVDDVLKQRNNDAMKDVRRYVDLGTFEHHGLVLFGPKGTGKTRLAVCVARAAARKGIKVSFQQVASIIRKLFDRDGGGRFAEQLGGFGLVVFDDLDKLTGESDPVRNAVFGVIDGMIGAGRCPVITTNMQGIEPMEKKLGEAVVSRLLGGCDWVEVPGDDYRVRQAAMRLSARKS